jgi:ABC-type multidrug transport system ATPase subunit
LPDPYDFLAANPKSEWQKNLPVVVFSRAKKSYGSGKKRSIVLDMFNMTIKEGSIYGLLGASGCGKTTVLSTIVGLKSLNQGIVEVFGGIPGDRKLGIPGNRIGYMPQLYMVNLQFEKHYSILDEFMACKRSPLKIKSNFCCICWNCQISQMNL